VPVTNVDEIPGEPRGTVLVFLLVYAALFHLELVLTALRGPKPSTTREPAFAVPVPLGWRDEVPGQRAIGVTFSFFVTAALTLAALWLLRHDADWYRGVCTLALAGGCLALGLLLPRLVRGRDPLAPPSPALALSVGYRIQAAALVVVAVPVMLSGVWITVAWAVLAVALAVAGATMNLAVSRAAGVFVWVLAAIHLAVWTIGAGPAAGTGAGPTAVWAVLFGQIIPAYLVMAALLAVVAHAIAALTRADWSPESVVRQATAAGASDRSAGGESTESAPNPDGSLNLNYESRKSAPPRATSSREFQSLASVADVLGTIAFALAAFAALPPIGFTAAILAQGWVLVGLGYVTGAAELHGLALLLIATAAGKWLLHDTLGWATGIGRTVWTTYRPVYNPVAAVGCALLASGVALRRVPLFVAERAFPRGRDAFASDFGAAQRLRAVRAIAGFGAVLVGLWLVSVEIDRYFDARAAATASQAQAAEFLRAKQVALSIVWSVYAVGCVAAGFAMRVAGLRYFGLALFALTVVKVMLVDLQSLQTGYRILSFLGLGLLLLGTSVLYGKLSPLLLRDADGGDAPRDEAEAEARSSNSR
jgi:hypothetical protein